MPRSRPEVGDPLEAFRRDWRDAGLAAEDAMVASTAIMRAYRALQVSQEAALRPFGLTPSRYEALVLLHFRPDGSVPMSQLAPALLVHPTSVTNTVDRLEEAGLVQRVAHPTDRRQLLVELTPAGRDLAERVVKALADDGFGVRGLSPSELATVARLLGKLRRAVGEFDG